MKEIDIDIPSGADLTDLDVAIEEAAEALGLHVALRGGLARYPGGTHWHFKRGEERGTLEITWWPREMRLWLSVRAERDAEWIAPAMQALRTVLETRLRGTT